MRLGFRLDKKFKNKCKMLIFTSRLKAACFRWREEKEEQDAERRKVNRHDEDRPPWSPPNKVIPRVR